MSAAGGARTAVACCISVPHCIYCANHRYVLATDMINFAIAVCYSASMPICLKPKATFFFLI